MNVPFLSVRPSAIFALVALSCFCASSLSAQTPESIFDEEPVASTASRIPDRVEGFNRAMFKFNDGLYRVTLRPLSKVYAAVVPRVVRRGVGNFFENLGFPIRFAGNLLEGQPGGAATETGRFLVNTVTSLGFAKVTDDIPELPERRSDLGQAFGAWGIGHGSYLVLPLLGPTSLRDGVGQGLSGYFLDPVHYLQEWEYRATASGLRLTNESPELMQSYEQLKEASIDPYIALRDAYSARRTRRVMREEDSPAIPAAASTLPE